MVILSDSCVAEWGREKLLNAIFPISLLFLVHIRQIDNIFLRKELLSRTFLSSMCFSTLSLGNPKRDSQKKIFLFNSFFRTHIFRFLNPLYLCDKRKYFPFYLLRNEIRFLNSRLFVCSIEKLWIWIVSRAYYCFLIYRAIKMKWKIRLLWHNEIILWYLNANNWKLLVNLACIEFSYRILLYFCRIKFYWRAFDKCSKKLSFEGLQVA